MSTLIEAQEEMRQANAAPEPPLPLCEIVRQQNHALTVEYLADLLQVSRLTIERWVKQRMIPCARIGRLIRFSPEAIYWWLRKRGL